MQKTLAVFDFDDTIINDNSDTVIVSLVGKNNIPQEIKDLHHREGWTAFMQGVFNFLFENDITEEMIKEQIECLPPIIGMNNLIKDLKKSGSYDIIIISDSNSYFINVYLEKHGLGKDILRVFTNPGHFVDGLLTVSPYHNQTTCKLCSKNLCKGQILDEFVKEQQEKNISYRHIVYIGDGANDFCPTLRLNSTDWIFARTGYKLQEIILKAKEGQSLDKSGKPHNIRAEVIFWHNGEDILEKIKK